MNSIMDGERFSVALATVVMKAATGFLEAVKLPPGRRPAAWLTDLSRWFGGLNPEEQHGAEQLAIRSAVAGARAVLGVIDGTIAIEPAGPKGTIVLTFQKDGQESALNAETQEMLEILFGFAIEDRFAE
jgi:hypothetical protein